MRGHCNSPEAPTRYRGTMPFGGVLPTNRMSLHSQLLLPVSQHDQDSNRLSFDLEKRQINQSRSLDRLLKTVFCPSEQVFPFLFSVIPILFIHACKLPYMQPVTHQSLASVGGPHALPNACKPVPAPANQRRRPSPSPCINTCNEAVGEEESLLKRLRSVYCQRIAMLLRGRGGLSSVTWSKVRCMTLTRYFWYLVSILHHVCRCCDFVQAMCDPTNPSINQTYSKSIRLLAAWSMFVPKYSGIV